LLTETAAAARAALGRGVAFVGEAETANTRRLAVKTDRAA